MPVVRKFLAASLIAIAMPTNGSANCEVGGYSIHTIAGYKSPDPKRVFLRHSVTSTGREGPVYFGDGSLCSYKKFERYPQPQQGAEGSFDRFRITRAFDFDLDGIVDVLEVNGEVAYWLDPLRSPEVIHWNMGC